MSALAAQLDKIDKLLACRVAKARLSAFLSQCGFISIDEVSIPLASRYPSNFGMLEILEIDRGELERSSEQSIPTTANDVSIEQTMHLSVARFRFSDDDKRKFRDATKGIKQDNTHGAMVGIAGGASGFFEVSIDTLKTANLNYDKIQHTLSQVAGMEIRVSVGQLTRLQSGFND